MQCKRQRVALVYTTLRPSTPYSQQSVFPARLRALADAEAFARGFADLQKLAHGDAMRLTLVIEELFTNTVKHGYGNETDSPVRLHFRLPASLLKNPGYSFNNCELINCTAAWRMGCTSTAKAT